VLISGSLRNCSAINAIIDKVDSRPELSMVFYNFLKAKKPPCGGFYCNSDFKEMIYKKTS